MAYFPNNPNGQATKENSSPVVLPSDQDAIPVTFTGSGDVATQTTLALIKTKTDNLDVLLSTRTKPADTQIVDGSGVTQPISAVSLPLPTGAATLTEQQTQTASLSVLDDWDETNRAAVNTIAGQVGVQGAAGTITALTQRVTIATDDEVNNLLGTIDVDTSTLAGAVSGSEMQTDIVAALPAGTNALGKLLPPDIDVTTHTNYAKKYYTSAGAVTDGIIWSPAAGKRWHVTTLYINVSAAATVTLEDDLVAGDSPVWKGELAANSGVVIPFVEKYPLASGEDAADLIITTSAGNVYVTCVGYEI